MTDRGTRTAVVERDGCRIHVSVRGTVEPVVLVQGVGVGGWLCTRFPRSGRAAFIP
jgi:hypothetical protein